MQNSWSKEEISKFTGQFKTEKVYRLINVNTIPQLIEVYVKSVEVGNGIGGIKFNFYDGSPNVKDMEYKTFSIDIRGNRYPSDFYHDRDMAIESYKNAILKRVEEIKNENNKRESEINKLLILKDNLI